MDKIYKSFVCNSLCRIEKKIFYPGNKVYLLNEFQDTMFNYLTVILAFGNWQGFTSKSYFEKHFHFVGSSSEPFLTNNIINQTKGADNE